MSCDIETIRIPFDGEFIMEGDTILPTVFTATSSEFPDLTSSTVKLQLYYHGNKVLDLYNGNGITIDSATQFTLDQLEADENNLPSGVSRGDLEITDGNGVRKTYYIIEYKILKQSTK